MNVYGIVCEYNPFHLGHLYHIRKTKLMCPDDSAIVCVMSPEFVQRGTAAVFDSYARAEAAVRSGADLVFELPLPWALSSAEGFARGAVGLLSSLGVVTHLSFGSECGDIHALEIVALALSSPEIQPLIKKQSRSQSFASARQKAVEELIGPAADLLRHPNNTLAIEYIRAIAVLDSHLTPVTIPRLGSNHDEFSQSRFKSASELRAMLASGHDISPFIPRTAADVYERETALGRGPITPDRLETAILSRLRALPFEAFAALPDASEGFHNRLRRAATSEPTWDAIIHAAKTKRYALSRIRRSLICAALGIESGMSRNTPPYATLLASGNHGRDLLRKAKKRSSIPVVTKPASARKLPPDSLHIFELSCSAYDLYALAFPSSEQRGGGSRWQKSPFILP